MNAPAERTIAAGLVRDFEAELPKTRALLEVVPEEHLDWKPHEKSMTLRQLAAHIAEAPTWLPSMIEGDEMDFEGMADSYAPFSPKSTGELLEAFEANAKSFRSAIEGLDDAFLSRDWTMRKGAEVLMSDPRDRVIRTILIHHLAHHRGQLTVYLRLLNVAVPATYGSTADHSVF